MSVNLITDKAISRKVIQKSFPVKFDVVNLGKSIEVNNTQSTTTAVNNAMSVLFTYIPTEIIALYVTVTAALGPITEGYRAQWITLFVFLVLTPIVIWLVYAAKLNSINNVIPYKFSDWPVWEMFASTIAFLSWAFALPQTPFNSFTDWYSTSLASVSILITSTVISLISPFFENK
jgi:hypothetical protein